MSDLAVFLFILVIVFQIVLWILDVVLKIALWIMAVLITAVVWVIREVRNNHSERQR